MLSLDFSEETANCVEAVSSVVGSAGLHQRQFCDGFKGLPKIENTVTISNQF